MSNIPEEIKNKIYSFYTTDTSAIPYSDVEYGYRLAIPKIKKLEKKIAEQAVEIERLKEKLSYQ